MVSDFYEEVFGSVQVLKQNRIKLATSLPCQVENSHLLLLMKST